MLFGKQNRIDELEAQVLQLGQEKAAAQAEVARLDGWVRHIEGSDAFTLATEIATANSQLLQTRSELEATKALVVSAQMELDTIKLKVIETSDVLLLQESGIYNYRHRLEDAVAYKSELASLKDSIKSSVKAGSAVTAAAGWTVNGSAIEGKRMIGDYTKLMLRAYNAEADNAVRTLKPYSLDSAIARLDKVREAIKKLGRTMSIEITDTYHKFRIRELELTADYLVKAQEEKERLREERERQREEEKFLREIAAEKTRLEKEKRHYVAALEKMRSQGDAEGAAAMEAKLVEIDSAFTGIAEREANIRAGYVYVISNFGSFGEHIIKIGMTRRLEPMDRVRELSDASVPFNFDVHALVFSDDALSLEAQLHTEFADKRVNLVNLRREYFYATPEEVRAKLEQLDREHLLEYRDFAEAAEWRASGGPERTHMLAGTHSP